MVARPGSLVPHALIKWPWSGVKLFGGLLDFPGRPGVSYFLAWLGMKVFILNTKDVLTIFFTQCYLAAILWSASLPWKHSTMQLVYWVEIVHFSPSNTRMVASLEISLFLFSAHSAPEMHPGWSKSVSWFVRGMDQVSSRTFRLRISSWYLIMCPHIDGCVMFGLKKTFFTKGIGRGESWAGMGLINYYGMDVEFFPLYFASIVPTCMCRVVISCE